MTAPQDPFATPGDEPSRPQDPAPGPSQPAYGAPPGFPPPAGTGGPAYGAPGGGGFGPPPSSRTNGMAVASLVLGILSILTGFFVIGGLFGIVAIVLGILGRGKAKRGEGGGGMALAGIVTGAIGLLLAVLLVAVVGTLWSNEDFSNLRECVEAAEDDAEAEECAQQFEDNVTSLPR